MLRGRHLALAIGLAAVWGFNFVVMEVGLRHFPPLLYTGLRFGLAALPVLFLGGPRVPWRWVFAAGATLGVGQYALLIVGMSAGMPAGLASLVVQVQAVFTTVLAVALLGERLTARRTAGMAVAFAGLALIGLNLGASGPLGPFLLVAGAAFAWGAGNVVVRRAAPPDSLRFMVWMSAVSAPVLLLLSFLIEGVPRVDFAAEGLLSLGYVSLVSTLGGLGVWGYLLRRHDASVVAPYALLVPVFGMSSAALFVGEPVTLPKLAAAVLIISGVFYAGRTPAAALAAPGSASAIRASASSS